MLPDHVYRNYYNEPCDDCQQVDINKGQTCPSAEDEWAVCGQCNNLLCEDCMGNVCDICDEHICSRCTAECEHCDDLIFHDGCKRQHTDNCNTISRAVRSVERASEELRTKERELERASRRVGELGAEIRDAERAKARAEANLQQAQARRNRRRRR